MDLTSIQLLQGAAGATGAKTYVDEVFRTYLYDGTTAAQTIGNGINLADKGGFVWIKSRNNTNSHALIDTARGAGKMLSSNNSSASTAQDLSSLSSFNANGFSLGNESGGYQRVNMNGQDYTSWSFRKTTGFFDVLTYTGNGSARTLAHSLGSIPGMIIVKKTNASDPWYVYHRSLDTTNPENYKIFLDESDTRSGANINIWNETKPTSTHFSLGSSDQLNGNGNSYVAYVFAGGESTAATARSVDFDGSNDYLALPNHSDLDLGNSDFTLEAWIKPNDASTTNQYFYSAQDNGLHWYWSQNKIYIYGYDGSSWFLNNIQSPAICPVGQWYHVAITRSSNVFRLFLNGIEYHRSTHTNTFKSPGSTVPNIGRYSPSTNNYFNGSVSNFRLVKGTALYTSSFRPPTEPLTNVTNTKLLCCNNSSAAGSTVTPGTITNNGATASTDSPFDDPEGFKFGEGGDQNIIKCGSYVGDGTKNHDIHLGWEPQWVMIKCTTAGENWILFDVMRGIVTDGNDGKDAQLSPNITGSEVTNNYALEVTGTGFKLTQDQAHINSSGNSYIFTAIRRPDGYVGKPAEAGTNVFAIAYGNSAGTNPSYVSNFPVDFSLLRRPSTPEAWYTQSRITGTNYLFTNTTNTESTSSNFVFDHNNGWRDGSAVTSYLSWMWKRHAGCDVLAYKGNDGTPIAHSLGKTPEMIWVKNRDNTDNWNVWHKDLNGGGIGAANYYLRLNTKDSEQNATNRFGGSGSLLPTSTTIFSSGVDSYQTNSSYYYYIAMLFASVDGISKVGYYDGSSYSQTITTGFSPRFVIIKKSSGSDPWIVLDTTRGWASGNDNYLKLDSSDGQTAFDMGAPTSTGFTVSTDGSVNALNKKYIYYAHA